MGSHANEDTHYFFLKGGVMFVHFELKISESFSHLAMTEN
jgi:hypothetical protein